MGLALYRNRPTDRADRDFGRPGPRVSADVGDGLTLGEAAHTTVFWYLTAITLLVNAVNTALLLDHVRALATAGLGRSEAIALLGAVTTMQAVATLATGVLVDRFGARLIGLLGLATLALSVLCVMLAPGLGGGIAYATMLGAMIGILQVVHSSGLAESFGTAHLGSIKGTTFVVGVSGAALGPLPFLYSADAAYWVFLAATFCAAAKFETTEKEVDLNGQTHTELRLAAKPLTYTALGLKPPQPEAAKVYRHFAAEHRRLQQERLAAFREYIADVTAGQFPDGGNLVEMEGDLLEMVMKSVINSPSASRSQEKP